jgi:DNA-binding XRE family transcriptional regulator
MHSETQQHYAKSVRVARQAYLKTANQLEQLQKTVR